MGSEFNYRNAYRLAVQTNRELHATIAEYKSLLDAAKAENTKLKERVEYLEQIQEWQYGSVYMGDEADDYDGC